MYGMETLKFCASDACQTTRTFVMNSAPRFPWSDDKFHTPETCAQSCSSDRPSETNHRNTNCTYVREDVLAW